jgi:4-amino-4-deoxy-L-arabinose transferase-like glycosyltransferase
MKEFLKKNKFIILIAGFFLFLLFFRLHNAINFNPYWGYDGGAHLEYIKTVMEKWRAPTMAENYLAWHEPLFYISYAGVGQIIHYLFGGHYDFYKTIIKPLQILSGLISVLMVWLVYKISQKFSNDKKVWLASAIGAGLISVMTETTNYLTNELLAGFFITLLLYYFITFSQRGWSWRRIVIMGLISGLALLTKLSAIIFILALAIWFLYKTIYERRIKYIFYAFVFLFLSFLIYSPWAIYKVKNFGSALSINVFEDKMKETRQLPEGFFHSFNTEIFVNPFWMNGSKSFASVVFADAFSDYYSISNNVDKNNLKVFDNQKFWTESGSFVTNNKFHLSILLLYFSIFFVFIFTFGVVGLFYKWIKNKFRPNVNFFFLIFIAGCFSALAYNVVKYPFLERGTLKASFILPVWSLLMVIGFSWLAVFLKKIKIDFLWIVIWFVVICWSVLSVIINWI